VKNPLRIALQKRNTALGGWIQIGHPAVAEIFAACGFDWIGVDLEHGAMDLETLTELFRAMNGTSAVPVARLPMNDPIWIRRALDAGARGLIVPMVNTPEEAEQAVRWAKYPPRGERGFGFSRANRYGRDFADYAANANSEIAMILQIEHRRAMEHLEAILRVPDVDGVFIGPYDLSGSYGKPGELDCPEMKRALKHFLRCCKKHRKAAGIHLVRPDRKTVQNALREGYSLVALGMDTVFLDRQAAETVRMAKHRP